MNTEKELLNHILKSNVDNCMTCGAKRTRVPYEDLPAEKKSEFDQDLDDIKYFLHCDQCNEYSAMLNFGGGFYGGPEKSYIKKFKSSPSLNAKCPCGSGDKYKRCCGKK